MVRHRNSLSYPSCLKRGTEGKTLCRINGFLPKRVNSVRTNDNYVEHILNHDVPQDSVLFNVVLV